MSVGASGTAEMPGGGRTGFFDVWDMTVPWLPLYWDIDVLARYHREGYSYVSLTLQDWPPTIDGMAHCIDRFAKIAAGESGWLTFAHSMEEIDQARRSGKLAVGLNSQETILIGNDLSLIETLYGQGIRHMLLAYNVRNFVADGCAEQSDSGLSNFGRRVVREMNRIGMLVDCAHTGRRSSLEAINLSELPAIFSHSSVHALHPHFRNVHDDQIEACAERGGVIGIVGVGAYLGDQRARSETMFRHIDYIAAKVGPEYVGLGSDYVSIYPMSLHREAWVRAETVQDVHSWPNAADAWPEQTGTEIPVEESYCFAPEQLAELIDIMRTHGYSETAIGGILGKNFRRVYIAAEAHRQRTISGN